MARFDEEHTRREHVFHAIRASRAARAPSKKIPLIKRVRGQQRSSQKNWGDRRGLNPRHSESQSDALPTELRPPQIKSANYKALQSLCQSANNGLPKVRLLAPGESNKHSDFKYLPSFFRLGVEVRSSEAFRRSCLQFFRILNCGCKEWLGPTAHHCGKQKQFPDCDRRILKT